jgi:hypothetical protein
VGEKAGRDYERSLRTLRIISKSRMAREASVIRGPLPDFSPRSSATRSSVPMGG